MTFVAKKKSVIGSDRRIVILFRMVYEFILVNFTKSAHEKAVIEVALAYECYVVEADIIKT